MEELDMSDLISSAGPRDMLLIRCRNTIQELQETLEKQQEKVEDLVSQNNTLKQRLKHLEDDQEFQEEESKRQEGLNFQLKQALLTVEDLKKEVVAKDKAMKEWSEAINYIEDKFKNIEIEQSNDKRQVEDLRFENDYLKNTLDFLKQENSLLKHKVPVKQEDLDKIKRLEREISKYNEVCVSLKAQNEELKGLLNESTSELHFNLESTDKNYKDLVAQKDRTIRELDKKLKELGYTHEKFMKDFENLKKSEFEYFSICQQLQETVNEKQNKITLLENKVKKTHEYYKDSLKKCQNEYEDKLAKAKEEFRDILKKKENENSQVVMLKENEKQAIRNKIELETQQTIAKFSEDFAKTNRVSDEEIVLLNQDRNKLKAVISELEAKVREAASSYNIELQKNQQLEQEIHFLNLKLQEVSDNLDEKIRETCMVIYEKEKIIERLKDGKIKKNKVCAWKDKFLEEIGYLTKWSETLEIDPTQSENYERLRSVIARLKDCLNLA